MKHLDPRTLNGVHDGELRGEALWRAQQHLEACADCRDALAALSSQDQSLRAVLTHDPGEEVFTEMSDKVAQRIEYAAKSQRPANAGEVVRAPFTLPWWQRPGVVVFAGAVTAVIAGAGVVLIASRNAEMPGAERENEMARRISQTAPVASSVRSTARSTAPVPGIVSLSSLADSMARAPALPPPPAAEPADERREVAASRLQKVETSAGGVERGERGAGPAFARAPIPGPTEARNRSRDLKRAAQGPLAEEKSANRPEEALAKPSSGAADQAGAPATAQREMAARELDASSRAEGAMRRDAASHRVCGVVRDGGGRPLAGVSVSASDVARSATSDATGRFCLELPSGAHTLQLMAVGFRSARLIVSDATGSELVATLNAVPVLQGGGMTAARANAHALEKQGIAPPSAALGAAPSPAGAMTLGTLASDDAALRALPDSLRDAVAAAARLQTGAGALGRAGGFDAAAASWERILPHMPPGRSEIEARARLAECRFRAWEMGHDAKRAERAEDALTAYIVRAPAGEKRNLAARWIDAIHSR